MIAESLGTEEAKFLQRFLEAGAHWQMVALTVVLFVLVAVFVELKPHVDENFFFATSDPAFGQERKVQQNFPSEPDLLWTEGTLSPG